MYATLIAVAACWGALAGALVPRVAYRLSVEPGEAWRDGCPLGHPYTGPAGGWIGGSGCGSCDTAADTAVDTAVRSRWLAPFLTAAVCTALAAATGPRPELAVWLLLVPVAVLLALVDLAVHRLPDLLTLPLAAAVALLLGAAALLPGHTGTWTGALLGGAALGGGYLALFLLHPRGLGFGDVKLAVAVGTALGWYGWAVLFAGAFAGFLLGSLYGLALIALRRATRKSAIPFGPFMLLGAFGGLLLGAVLAAAAPP
ncbi:prepilin peptidase [Streptomyces sp. MUM 178J]|uniref:prepilin peptidase n=1 Tax=Streptomyces sp. MUM 178J TaxID=2791991 RepID=UPI001F04B915|nr:A24 family peptidase [Streptomyces sp. MUM 178J]WRQ81589.1 A24 family peptidase [Streptomyces sp. MUM 178J]